MREAIDAVVLWTRLASRPAIRVAVGGSFVEAHVSLSKVRVCRIACISGEATRKLSRSAWHCRDEVAQDRSTQEHSGGVAAGLVMLSELQECLVCFSPGAGRACEVWETAFFLLRYLQQAIIPGAGAWTSRSVC